METPKIRLFIDAHGFDDYFQGSRTYLSGLYRSMIEIAPDIHFYFAAHNISNLENEFGLHGNVSYLKFKRRNNVYRLLIDTPRLIRRNKIDLAHFQYAVPFFKMCREIVTIHDVLFLDFPQYFPFLYKLIRKPIFKRSARRADLLLTVSNYARESIAKNFGLEPGKIKIVPNGIDKSFCNGKENDIENESVKNKFSPYILYVSRIEPRKNHVLLLEIFKELNLSDLGYRMIFIGKIDIGSKAFDDYRKELTEKEKRSVFLLDSIPQSELASFYKNASLFIYPSLAEGFGIPPIEAAALGVAVLCSNATAMADFTFFGNYMFDPSNKEELKKKVMGSLTTRNDRFTRDTKNHVLSKYDWNIIAGEFLKLLLECSKE